MYHGFAQQLGFGLGYRKCHFDDILRGEHNVQWFEAITENYLGLTGLGPGPSLKNLETLRAKYPIVLHGVSLSIGSTHPLSREYLTAAKKLFDRIQPEWVSDHLCWTGVHGANSHDLLPLPYTLATIDHVVARIQEVQEFWQRPLVIENVSSYVTFNESKMTESEFVAEIVKKSGCKLLLDVNNIYVSARNHHTNAADYLKSVPWQSVVQIHLAGHTDQNDLVIDTHDADVRPEVWGLYHQVLCYARDHTPSPVATMIERDGNIPAFSELVKELEIARTIQERMLHGKESSRPAEIIL
jgi:uncharacterized protein